MLGFGKCTIPMNGAGIQRYLDVGVRPDQLILARGTAMLYFKRNNPTDRYCPIAQVPFRGINCSGKAGSGKRIILNLLQTG